MLGDAQLGRRDSRLMQIVEARIESLGERFAGFRLFHRPAAEPALSEVERACPERSRRVVCRSLPLPGAQWRKSEERAFLVHIPIPWSLLSLLPPNLPGPKCQGSARSLRGEEITKKHPPLPPLSRETVKHRNCETLNPKHLRQLDPKNHIPDGAAFPLTSCKRSLNCNRSLRRLAPRIRPGRVRQPLASPQCGRLALPS